MYIYAYVQKHYDTHPSSLFLSHRFPSYPSPHQQPIYKQHGDYDSHSNTRDPIFLVLLCLTLSGFPLPAARLHRSTLYFHHLRAALDSMRLVLGGHHRAWHGLCNFENDTALRQVALRPWNLFGGVCGLFCKKDAATHGALWHMHDVPHGTIL